MRIFLSYSTPDYQTADQIRGALKARRPDLDIYFAPRRNEVGAYWLERLGTEIESAEAVILLIGRRIGPWQELEYYDALKRNRNSGHPLIAPVLLAETAPGLPFFDQFHRLSLNDCGFDDLINLVLHALDGASSEDLIAPWRQINPYSGLPAMGTQDAAFFFGRETLSGEILSRLETYPDKIHALIGNSGVGKSSLAMAGILAALRSRLWPGDWDRNWPAALAKSHTWPLLIMKPGESPVKTLAQTFAGLWLESPADIEEEALKWRRLLSGESSLSTLIDAALERVSAQAAAEQPERLALYIDQAEELYSRAEVKEQRLFSALLADAVANSKLLVMISLRSDYYGSLQEDTALFKAAHPIDVPPLDKEGIEQVIHLPAERLAVRFENPDLIALIAEATEREPGALPMLSDLLSDAWRLMSEAPEADGVLRFPFQIVDISRPLAEKAERFFTKYRNLEAELKRLFTLKLAHVTKEGQVMRRRARSSDCSKAEWMLVEKMVERDWRLVSTGVEAGEPVAEVAHEALLRNCPRLSSWLDESREFLIWKGQFEPDRVIWEEADISNRSRALLTGLRLDKALYWQNSRSNDLTPTESRFITDSANVAARNARQRTWLQRALWVLLIVVAVVAALAVEQRNTALQAEQQAVTERDRAQHQSSLAVARRLAMAAEKMLDENIGETTLAGLLSVESLKRMPTPEAQQVLRRVLEFTPGDSHEVNTPWPWAKILHSPDNKLTAYYRLRDSSRWKPAAGRIAMMDTNSWNMGTDYHQQGRIWPVFSHNGRWLAMAGYGRRLQVVDVHEKHLKLDLHQDDMINAVFGPDDRLYIARTDGVIEIRVAPDWQVLSTLGYPLKNGRPKHVDIKVSLNGGQLLVLADNQEPVLITVDNGRPIELKGHSKSVTGGTFCASDRQVVTSAWGGEMIVWDAQSGKSLYKVQQEAEISSLTTSSDGERIITATRDGAVVIRDARTGEIQRQLAHEKWINAVAVSNNDRYLATASDDRTVALWNLDNGEKLLSLPHDDEVWTVKFGRNDKTLITGGKDGELRIFDALNGKLLQRMQFEHGITSLAHNTQSTTLAVGLRETEHEQAWADLIITDRQTGRRISQLQHNGGFSNITFSPDSLFLATTTGGVGTVKIWDTRSGSLRAAPGLLASSLFFTHDSSRLVAGKYLRETVIIDTSDGKRLAMVGEPGGVENLSVAADLHTLTTFGQDRSFRGWDALDGKMLWQRQSSRPNDSINISTDGSRFADFSSDRRHINVGVVRTGQILATIPAKKNESLLLSQNGLRLQITRTNLTDKLNPNLKYSEVELWNIEAGKILFSQKYKHRRIASELLPGDRFAIITAKLTKQEPEGVVDIIDAKQGIPQWSVPIATGFAKVLVPRQQNDIVIIAATGARQIRDIATGKIIIEMTGGGGLAAEIAQEKNLLVIDNGQSIELRNIKNGELVRKIPVAGYVHDLALSNDGRLLFAAISNDYINGIKVWRTADWSESRFIEMDNTTKSLYPLADPDLFARLDNKGTLKIWRLSSGSEEQNLSHTFTAENTRMASEANRIITWQGASMRIWNPLNGSEIAQRTSRGKISSLAISPDGRTVAFLTENKRTARRGGDYKPLVIWETDSSDEPIELPMQAPRKVLFDPSGHRLVVLHRDQSIQMLDVATLRTLANIPALPDSKVVSLDFSAAGTLLFIREIKKSKRGLRVFSFSPLQEITRVDASSLTESAPEAEHVMSRDGNGIWRAWTPSASDPDELLWKIPTYQNLLPIPDTSRILDFATKSGVELFDLEKRSRTTVVPAIEDQFLRNVTIDPQGKLAALALDSFNSGKDTGKIFLRDVKNGAEIASLQTGISMEDMAFVNGGDTIVMSNSIGIAKNTKDAALWLWQWRTGELLKLSSDNPINAIAVSPEDSVFASAEGALKGEILEEPQPLGTFQIRIWDARTGKTMQQIPQKDVVHDLAFSRDGQYLAVKMTRNIIIYQIRDWLPVREFVLQGTVLNGGKIAFAKDNRIVVMGQNNAIRIWSLDGKEQRILRHEDSNFPIFQLSRDLRWLVTEEKGRLRVWDVETGSELFRAEVSDSTIPSFAFAGSAGDTLVANVKGRLVRIHWKTDELIAEACRRLARSMTEAEWQRFLDQEPYEKTCPGNE